MILLPDFFGEIERIEREMRELLSKAQANGTDILASSYSRITPPIDVYEKKGVICVVLDVPGIPLDRLSVDYINGYVIISGEKEHYDDDTCGNFLCIERTYGSFSRKIFIKNPVDFSKTTAELSNGVLTVVLHIMDEKRGEPVSIKITDLDNKEKV